MSTTPAIDELLGQLKEPEGSPISLRPSDSNFARKGTQFYNSKQAELNADLEQLKKERDEYEAQKAPTTTNGESDRSLITPDPAVADSREKGNAADTPQKGFHLLKQLQGFSPKALARKLMAGVKPAQKETDTDVGEAVSKLAATAGAVVTDPVAEAKTAAKLAQAKSEVATTFYKITKKAESTKTLTDHELENLTKKAQAKAVKTKSTLEAATRAVILEHAAAKVSTIDPTLLTHTLEPEFSHKVCHELKKVLPKGATVDPTHVQALTNQMLKEYGSANLPQAALKHNDSLKEMFWKTVLKILDMIENLFEEALITVATGGMVIGTEMAVTAVNGMLDEMDGQGRHDGVRGKKDFSAQGGNDGVVQVMTLEATESFAPAILVAATAARYAAVSTTSAAAAVKISITSTTQLADLLSKDKPGSVSEGDAKGLLEWHQEQIGKGERGLTTIAQLLEVYTLNIQDPTQDVDVGTTGNGGDAHQHLESDF